MATTLLIFFCLLGVSICQLIPDNLLITQAVKVTFTDIDRNPKDGNLTLQELYDVIVKEDVNKDGCVSQSEFTRVNHIPIPEFSVKLFDHYDHDDDGCITKSDEQRELGNMDSSGDSIVTQEEFEPYVINLLKTLLSDIFPIDGIIGK